MAIASKVPLDDITLGIPGAVPPLDEPLSIAATVDGLRVHTCYAPNGRKTGTPPHQVKLAWFALYAAWLEMDREDDPDQILLGDERQVIETPDVVIVEGLNVLQTGANPDGPRTFVSDFFDFSIYIDADADTVRQWYIERFLTLRESAFADPRSYFSRYAGLSDDEAVETAGHIWDNINGPNLVENIEPTRERADLILRKGGNHRVEQIRLRRL